MRTNEILLDSYKDIPATIKKTGASRPFLCCGKSFEQTEAFKFLKASLDLTVWDSIRPNPRYEDMLAAAELFRREKCDFMIGAGGGSPLDSAKMIKLLATNHGKVGYSEPLDDNDIPFLAIPTTSGTGSEATRYSIFYVNENQKYSVSHPGFLPGYVLLDPDFLKTVNDYQRKCTCLDALAHAIESYWSVRANAESQKYAEKAIRIFVACKDEYMRNETRGNSGMMLASYNAGKAIDITSTTAAHAMCYNITMNCSTSHGHSVAVGLAEIWKYMLIHNNEVNDRRGRSYVLQTFEEISEMLGGKGISDGPVLFENILREFGLPFPKATLSQCNSFAKSVRTDRLKNNPTVLTLNDVQTIYRNILLK